MYIHIYIYDCTSRGAVGGGARAIIDVVCGTEKICTPGSLCIYVDECIGRQVDSWTDGQMYIYLVMDISTSRESGHGC